jgi:hypothetical protein
MHDIDVPTLFRLWHSDMRSDDIAVELGITRDQLYRAKVWLKLPNRLVRYNEKAKQRLNDPTPEEIEERAAVVRAGWPPGEAEKRLVGRRAERVEIRDYKFCRDTCVFSY